VKLAPAQIVAGLRDFLGARLVAYIGNVSNTRSVRDWVEGTHMPSAQVVQRLRTAYYIAGLLREREGAATVQSWFLGMNPQLEDRSPAWMLREQPGESAGPAVIAAARSFAALG